MTRWSGEPGSDRRPSGWTTRTCIVAALATAGVGLAGARLVPARAPDDAFRARLEAYRRIGEALGRGPPAGSNAPRQRDPTAR